MPCILNHPLPPHALCMSESAQRLREEARTVQLVQTLAPDNTTPGSLTHSFNLNELVTSSNLILLICRMGRTAQKTLLTKISGLQNTQQHKMTY